MRISQSFYLVLGRSADLMLHTDYFSKRGFGNGVTLRTRPNPVTSLTLDWYWVNDRKDQGGTSFNGIGETKLPHGFRAAAEFNLVSSFLFRQVFSDNFRTATLPTDTSLVFVTNNYQSRSFNVLVSREETIFEGPNVIIRKTPALSFKLIGQKLPNLPLPLYLDLDTSAAGLNRTRFLPLQPGAPDASPFETPGMTQRLDFSPQLYFSLPLFQGLRVTPGVGFRETFYSNSLQPGVDPAVEDPVSAANIHRGYLELTMGLQGWGLSKVYRNSSGREWKHLIEPLVRYRYITGIDDFDRIIRFDEQDAVANTHEVEYALFNRIFAKRTTANGELNHEWLSFKIAQKYFFDSNFGGALQPGTINQFFPLNTLTSFPYAINPRHYSPVTALLRFTPQPGYSFDLRGDYDPKFNTLRNFSVTGFLNRPGLFLGTTYFVTKETPDLADVLEDLLLEPGTFKNNQLQAQVALGNLERGISVSSTLSYDVHANRLLSHRSRLNYFWDCCGVSVNFRDSTLGYERNSSFVFRYFSKGSEGSGPSTNPPICFKEMIYLSLGSNLGDREAQLRKALEELHQKGVLVVKESSIYETEPVDAPDQPDFLNLVCQVETSLEPASLLSACQEIESRMGRRRGKTKKARNIDIDILLYGRQIVDKPLLKIPHPAWQQRNFVLIPLTEIAPDFRDPVSDQTVEVLQQQSCDGSRVTPYIDRLSLQRSS